MYIYVIQIYYATDTGQYKEQQINNPMEVAISG